MLQLHRKLTTKSRPTVSNMNMRIRTHVLHMRGDKTIKNNVICVPKFNNKLILQFHLIFYAVHVAASVHTTKYWCITHVILCFIIGQTAPRNHYIHLFPLM